MKIRNLFIGVVRCAIKYKIYIFIIVSIKAYMVKCEILTINNEMYFLKYDFVCGLTYKYKIKIMLA